MAIPGPGMVFRRVAMVIERFYANLKRKKEYNLSKSVVVLVLLHFVLVYFNLQEDLRVWYPFLCRRNRCTSKNHENTSSKHSDS